MTRSSSVIAHCLFVELLGRQRVDRDQAQLRLTRFEIQATTPPPATALRGAVLVPLVDQEPLTRREQERAKSPTLGIGRLERPLLEKSSQRMPA